VRRRRAVVVLIAIATLYTAMIVTILGCGVTDKLLLYPSHEYFNPGTATRHPIATKNGELEVWRAKSLQPGEPRAFVLRFYGNADRADIWAASEAASLPMAAELWGVNYPGFGGSGGSATLRGVAESALIAFDALRQQANGKPIYVFGTSLGTTAALHIAAQRDVAGVLLHNPPPLRQLIRGQYGWWNLWLLAVPIAWGVPSELDSIANASIAKAPAIFVLSEEDEIVGHKYALMVRDAYGGPKRTFVMPGLRHNDEIPAETRKAIETELLKWVSSR
jgi:pimeloyl-ACP methyl ester carboxylesterase